MTICGVGVVTYEQPADGIYEQYLGGYGLGAYYLFTRQPGKVDALGPSATLGFVTGMLTGTPAITGNRFVVVGKSPKTGGWGDANCGGRFGPALKRAGLDAVFVTGVAAKPAYLVAEHGTVTIGDASPYWGLLTGEVEERCSAEFGERARTACIGPAGERVRALACVITDKGRAAGRSGLGMVMGSKRLKAVVAIGTGDFPVAQKRELMALRKQLVEEYCNSENSFWAERHTYGTCGSLESLVDMGDTPVRNWAGWHPSAAAVLSVWRMDRTRARVTNPSTKRSEVSARCVSTTISSPYAASTTSAMTMAWTPFRLVALSHSPWSVSRTAFSVGDSWEV